ncbi:competence type IV pilus minor pilin ComGF [Bacillus alkalicellulosilyticus]|uniref:competence type IV pilus minor pilin ComGF n=1 Tax=Alkalihalobacterium alkalicellulosilyticum TaxID=1912214 RepID=UPI00148205D6|nr:competence type IV pilus minor pilin ComGF [Bacillus alkalicellulosilyticus]
MARINGLIIGVIMVKNEAGVTLLEMLMSLFIFMIVVSIFPLFMATMNKNEPNLKDFEVQLFYSQLVMEVREARVISVHNNRLSLTKWDGSLVTIEKYGNKVRRLVNQAGHDVMLQGVDVVLFQVVPEGVTVKVGALNERIYERRLSKAYIHYEQ